MYVFPFIANSILEKSQRSQIGKSGKYIGCRHTMTFYLKIKMQSDVWFVHCCGGNSLLRLSEHQSNTWYKLDIYSLHVYIFNRNLLPKWKVEIIGYFLNGHSSICSNHFTTFNMLSYVQGVEWQPVSLLLVDYWVL